MEAGVRGKWYSQLRSLVSFLRTLVSFRGQGGGVGELCRPSSFSWPVGTGSKPLQDPRRGLPAAGSGLCVVASTGKR